MDADKVGAAKINQLASPGIITYTILSALLAIVVYFIVKRRRLTSLINKIPGPKTLPIFGNALEVNVEPAEVFQRVIGFTRIWGYDAPFFRAWMANRPFVFLYRPSHVETILSSPNHIDKSKDYDYLHPWLGTGLLTATETAMGVHINAQGDNESEYVKAVYKLAAIVQKRQARPWLQPDLLYNFTSYAKDQENCLRILHGHSYAAINQRREEYLKEKRSKVNKEDNVGSKRRLAFLDLLLEYSADGTVLDDESIREEVDTFMFEGHDTTAAAIAWSVYLFGCYPEIQRKAQEEVDAIFNDMTRPVTADDLRELKYLECCIKEALRIFPSVPFIGRHLNKDIVIDGYTVPAGTTALIVTYSLHRDTSVFPNPEVFEPDRFLPENCENRHPFAYVPFSAGPRNCIGQKFAMMEEKTVLSYILKNFRIESVTRREDMRILGELILRPEKGISVRLFPRD